MKLKLSTLLVLIPLLLLAATVGVLAAPTPQDEPPDAAARVDEIRAHTPAISDDFSANQNGWTEDANEAGNGVQIVEEAYHLRLESSLNQALLAGVANVVAENFLIEVDAVPVELYGYSEFGLVFRMDANESLLFFVTTDGTYALIKADGGSLNFVVEPAPSTAIDLDDEDTIRLGLLADGNQISLLANGDVLTTVSDPDPISGELGVFITASDAGPLEVAFDNFTLWDLDDLGDPQPAATPEAEARSPEERLAEIRSQDPIYSDDFASDNDDWFLPERDSHLFSYDNSALRIETLEPELVSYALSEAIIDLTPAGYFLEVDAAPSDPELGIYGLVFGYRNDDNFHSFWITEDEYVLQGQADDDWETLIDWTASDTIAAVPNATNRLGVLVEGDELTLFVNDELVDQFSGADVLTGTLGLAAVGSDSDVPFTVDYDNLRLWAVEPITDEITVETPETIRSRDPGFTEDFGTDDGAWTDDGASTVFFYDEEAAALYAQIDEESSFHWVASGAVDALMPDHFLAEVETRLDQGDGNYGIVFRLQDEENYYLFVVWDDSYALRVRVDGEWETLIDWTPSDEIRTGRRPINHLGVLAQGSAITLLINDLIVERIEDDTLASGTVGLGAGTFENGEIEVTFDDFSLWLVDVAPVEESADVDPDAVDFAEQLDALRATEPAYEETFRRTSDAWPEDLDDDAGFFVEGGAFRAQINVDNYSLWYVTDDLNDLELDDYLVEVDVWTEQQALEAEYGLVFRLVDRDNFYWFTISDGWYSVYKKEDGEWSALVEWTESDAINPEEGDLNRLGVWIEGNTILLLVDDEPVAEIVDDAFSAGPAGVAAGTFDEGGLDVAFDNFTIWTFDALYAGEADAEDATMEEETGAEEEEDTRRGR